MTKEERGRLENEFSDLVKIISVYENEPYTRFCVTIIDDVRNKYQDVRIEDYELQERIVKVLKKQVNHLKTKLNITYSTDYES